MKELELSQDIHVNFWGTERPCESQFVNNFCHKSRKNSESQQLGIGFFNFTLNLKWPKYWREMVAEKWVKQPGGQTEILILFDQLIICCLYFSSTKTVEKSFEHPFLSSQGDWSTSCSCLHGGFAAKVVGCRWAQTRVLPLSPDCGVGQQNCMFKPCKCGKLQLWILWEITGKQG